MTTDVSSSDDVIDSRDVIARIEELREELEDVAEDDEAFASEREELKALEALAEQAEGYADWQDGATLIRDSHFQDYAQELAEDIGAIKSDAGWPYTCIDEQAATDLQMDYTSVEFDGVTYWVR